MPRSASRLVALLLGASALAGCSLMGATPDLKDRLGVNDKPASPKTAIAAAGDIDGNLRQAKLLRQAGSYDEAIHILSQLMLMAADDPRVVAEYGKTLAQKGRASDATQFLRRAIELSPNDWTLYSALGVSYDQIGDQVNARAAYEHALDLRPNEPSVLNNYALSRMLAKDPEAAKALIVRAEIAAGPGDEKIARNVALINKVAPDKPVAVAIAAPQQGPSRSAAKALPKNAPKAAAPQPAAPKLASTAPASRPVAAPAPAPMTPAPSATRGGGPQNAQDVARLLAAQPMVEAPKAADGAPRPLLAPQQVASLPPIPVAEAQPFAQAPALPPAPAGVVMQAVPYDPYAGPVVTLKKPQAKAKAVAKADGDKSDADKRIAQKAPAPVKKTEVPALRVAADKY